MGIFKRFFFKEKLDKGLEPSKQSILDKIGKAVAGKSTVDASVLDQLEEALISADIGVDTTLKIIDLLEKRVARDKYMNAKELQSILREEITSLLELHDDTQTDVKPKVTLVVGVMVLVKPLRLESLPIFINPLVYESFWVQQTPFVQQQLTS